MNDPIKALAAMIYGEAGGEDEKVMKMVGSTAVNRAKSKRVAEFGEGLLGVLMHPNAYYAVQDNSPMFQQAVSGDFPDKMSETAYKKALQIASGLLKGSIEPTKGMFYFKPEEVKDLKRRGKKVFNFDAVENVGEVGPYQTYSY